MSQRYDRLGLILPVFILLVYAAAFIYGEFRPGTRWTLDSYEYAAAATNLVESGTFYAGDLDGARDPALPGAGLELLYDFFRADPCLGKITRS